MLGVVRCSIGAACETVAAYGSFNFRCLFEKTYTDRTELARFFNCSFKRFVLYETYFVMGEDNSLNSINAPRFYDIVRQKAFAGHPYWRGVRKSIAIWNNHIVLSQLRSVQKVSTAMFDNWQTEDAQITTAASGSNIEGDTDAVWKKRKTNVDKMLQGGAKIVNSIIVARGQQMVFADFGLTTLLLNESRDALSSGTVVQCNIAFDEGRGNTILKPTTDDDDNKNGNKVFVIKNVNRAKLIECLEKAIEV